MAQHRKRCTLFAVISFLSIFFLTCSAIAESDDLEVTVLCPSRVSVGGTVVIGLEVTNNGYAPVQISKSAVVAAYPGAYILGPYTMPLSGSIDPGETISVPNYAAYNISPNIPNGTLIGHGVCLFGADFNHLLGCGGAVTEVLNK
jgi:hypothetical protein